MAVIKLPLKSTVMLVALGKLNAPEGIEVMRLPLKTMSTFGAEVEVNQRSI